MQFYRFLAEYTRWQVERDRGHYGWCDTPPVTLQPPTRKFAATVAKV